MRQIVKEKHDKEFEIAGEIIKPTRISVFECYYENQGKHAALLKFKEKEQAEKAFFLDQDSVETLILMLTDILKSLQTANNPNELMN